MTVIGYIVQYSNEEEYTIYHGFMKLHKHFSEALERAKELYRSFLSINDEHYDGPFNAYTPTKKECDAQGSVVVFESPAYIVWIDAVVE